MSKTARNLSIASILCCSALLVMANINPTINHAHSDKFLQVAHHN